MRNLDQTTAIEWVDIVRDKEALVRSGVSYQQAMERFHAIDERGQLQTGVRAFLVVWKYLPYYRQLALIVENVPGLLFLMEYVYRIFAAYRLHLSERRHRKEKDHT